MSDHPLWTCEKISEPQNKRFKIVMTMHDQETLRTQTRVLYISNALRKVPYTEEQVYLAVDEVMRRLSPSVIFGRNSRDPDMIPRSEISAMILRLLKNKTAMIRLAKAKNVEESGGHSYPFEPAQMHRYGMFYKEPKDSGRTQVIFGASFSGKTHFLSQQLNKLPSGVYDRVLIFTESPNSDPLKKLKKELDAIIVPMFVPRIIKILTQIQRHSKNHFRFLTVLDDVVTGIRGSQFTRQILTMRNSQISTCILLQYPKLITPAQRNSMHAMYFVQLRIDDWIYLLQNFIGPLIRPVMGNEKYPILAEKLRAFMQKQGRILKFDQVHDAISLIDL